MSTLTFSADPRLAAQVLGWLSISLTVWGLAGTCDKRVRVTSVPVALLWAANNFLLGATTAAGLCLLSSLRNAIAAWVPLGVARHRSAAFWLFTLLTLLVAAATWNGWLSVSTAASSLVVTYALYHSSGVKMRLLFALSVTLWMHNAYEVQSLEQVVSNVIALSAALAGAWRTWKAPAFA